MPASLFRLSALALLAAALAPGDARAQAQRDTSHALRGVVAAFGPGHPLGYSSVDLPELGRARFATETGTFVFTGLAAGPVRLRVRQLGYAPLDTVVTVGPGSGAQPLRLELRHIAVRIAGVRVTARQSCAHPGPPDSETAPELRAIFDQLHLNAERYRLLADTYPFQYRAVRLVGMRTANRRERVTSTDTLVMRSDARPHYVPGEVVRRSAAPGRSAEYDMRLPTLPDFADEGFQRHHCFTYGGTDEIDGVPAIRVDFQAWEKLREPDIDGSVFLDPTTYQIRRADVRLTRVPPSLRSVTGVEVTTSYREIAPSIVMIDRVLAVTAVKPGRSPSAITSMIERQDLLDFVFVAGAPGR